MCKYLKSTSILLFAALIWVIDFRILNIFIFACLRQMASAPVCGEGTWPSFSISERKCLQSCCCPWNHLDCDTRKVSLNLFVGWWLTAGNQIIVHYLNYTRYNIRLPKHTFRLEPMQSMTSAILAASAAPFQLRGCSRVPRSPKCTMVSLSSPPQWLHVRLVPCLCSDVRSVTSNKRTYSLTGEQDVHTWRGRSKNTAGQGNVNKLSLHWRIKFIHFCFADNKTAKWSQFSCQRSRWFTASSLILGLSPLLVTYFKLCGNSTDLHNHLKS